MGRLELWITGAPVPAAERARGTFARMMREAIGETWQGEYEVIDCATVDEGFARRELDDGLRGVVISGSPARIADQEPWMVRTQDALRRLVRDEVPLFGICFGHQLLGQALGGHSGPNPAGREMGTVEFRLTEADPLFGAAGSSHTVIMTHLDSVLELPPDAVALGQTDLDGHAAIRFGPRAWGVQFHPEMDAEIIRHYIEARRADLQAEGADPDSLIQRATDAPESRELLRRFAAYVTEQAR